MAGIAFIGTNSRITDSYFAGHLTNGVSRYGLADSDSGGSTTGLSSCFWDATLSGETDDTKGNGLTTEEMQNRKTYSDELWSSTVWNLVNGSYPTLKIDWK